MKGFTSLLSVLMTCRGKYLLRNTTTKSLLFSGVNREWLTHTLISVSISGSTSISLQWSPTQSLPKTIFGKGLECTYNCCRLVSFYSRNVCVNYHIIFFKSCVTFGHFLVPLNLSVTTEDNKAAVKISSIRYTELGCRSPDK